MSTVASSNSNLTINADGSGNDIKFQSNGTEVGSINSSGTMTATAFAGDGSSLTGISSGGGSGTIANWQHVRYDVTGEQAMTTTYADALGSDISYTPASGASYVCYQYNFLFASAAHASDAHLSGKVLLDGTVETETTHHLSFEGATGHMIVNVVHVVDCSAASWTGAKTIKYQAREYDSSNQSQLHATVYHDGGFTEVLHRPIMIIYSVL